MKQNDPLRDPKVVKALATSSQAQHFIAALIVALSIISYFVFLSFGWPLLVLSVAIVFFLNGCNLSFEVYKRRKGYQCDLYPWLSDPKSWIPKNHAVQVTQNKKSNQIKKSLDSSAPSPHSDRSGPLDQSAETGFLP